MSGPTGSFVSPNYPQPYGHNAECYWTISVARGSSIHLDFHDFSLEAHDQCAYDFVEVKKAINIKWQLITNKKINHMEYRTFYFTQENRMKVLN